MDSSNMSSPPSGSVPMTPDDQLAAFPPSVQAQSRQQPVSSSLVPHRRPLDNLMNYDPFLGGSIWNNLPLQLDRFPIGVNRGLGAPSLSSHQIPSLSTEIVGGSRALQVPEISTDNRANTCLPSPAASRQLWPPDPVPANLTLPPPDDEISKLPHDRWFIVDNVPIDTEILGIVHICKSYKTIDGPFTKHLNSLGQFFVGFRDMREARVATEHILSAHPNWTMLAISKEAFERETMIVGHPPHGFEDQVLVLLYCGPHFQFSGLTAQEAVVKALELMGSIQSIRRVSVESTPNRSRLIVHEFVVRFYDSQHAINAIKALNAGRTEYYVLEVLPYWRGLEMGQSPVHWTNEPPPPQQLDNRNAQSPPSTHRRSYSNAMPERNRNMNGCTIDRDRIIYHDDPRTTVMLKNIPNAMGWRKLKEILDMTSFARYDCMYLRMDFNENQNVGYAFVNFLTPQDILPFMDAVQGRPWPDFPHYRDKIADISYANIQGREGYAQQFRNSPVILDIPENRPKMFFVHGSRAGDEAPFPPVNNFYVLAKGVNRSRRSGLFRGGPHNRPSEGVIETPVRTQRRERAYDTPHPNSVVLSNPYGSRRHNRHNSQLE